MLCVQKHCNSFKADTTPSLPLFYVVLKFTVYYVIDCIRGLLYRIISILEAYKYYKCHNFHPTMETACTFCRENPFAHGKTPNDRVIDHILVRHPEADTGKFTAMVSDVHD